jgi:uncharacterized FAD-dependent dehydrogenase
LKITPKDFQCYENRRSKAEMCTFCQNTSGNIEDEKAEPFLILPKGFTEKCSADYGAVPNG